MTRNTMLDVCKGVLIILVILGHAIQYGSGAEFMSTHFWDHIVCRFIYSFHMPLFMGVAGYLSFFSLQKHSVGIYIKRRWIKLLPPICIWGACIWGLHCMKEHILPFSSSVFIYILSTFWFLWALLIIGTVIAVSEKLHSLIKSFIYISLLALSCVTPDGLNWGLYKFMFPCFLIGFYTAKCQLYRYFSHWSWLIISVCVWILLIPLFNTEAYIYTTGFSLFYSRLPIPNQLFIDVFRYLIAIVASITVLSCINYLMTIKFAKQAKDALLKFLSYCGKHSLAIYILSTYQFIYILPRITKTVTATIFLNLTETFIILGFCILIQRILNKNKYLSQLIIGE